MISESKTPQRIEAAFEVLAAGFGGWIITAMFLVFTGIQGSASLEKPVWMAVVLVAEALVTFLIIILLEGSASNCKERILSLLKWSPTEIAIGAALVPVLYFAVLSSGILFEYLFPRFASEGNPLLEIIRTPFDLAAFLAAGIFSGGIKEEVQRAFILLRFERFLGGAAAGLVLWSVVFGLGHYEQGWSNAFSAGILGLVFGLVFLFRRNLFTTISAHALYDVTVLIIYWNYFRD